MSNLKKTSKPEWLAKVETDLKGKPIGSLNWEIAGIFQNPIYTLEDIGNYSPISADSNTWEIGHIIYCNDDYKLSNKKALAALNHGSNALLFDIVENININNLSILLENIQFEWISLHFILGQKVDTKVFHNDFHQLCLDNNFAPERINCSFRTSYNNLINSDKFRNSKTVFISPTTYNGVIGETLGVMLKKGNLAIESFANNGKTFEYSNSKIQFALEATDNYFLNIATIRAFKLLWQNVISAWSESARGIMPNLEMHISTLDQVKDENTNKIKAGSQALSAAIGGVDRIVIHPTGNLTSFSERIALNVHHLIQAESHISTVVDPSAGSYYIEQLTDKICEQAWSVFQNSEK